MKEVMDLVSDDRISDELKSRIILAALKVQKAKTIAQAKEGLQMIIGVLDEIEKITDGK